MWQHPNHAHNNFQVHPDTICASCSQRAGRHFPTNDRSTEFDRCESDVDDLGKPLKTKPQKPLEPGAPVDRGNGPGED